ncbi:MAG: ATP12 family chaperone protein, partial [Caulobacteraceae bacterium]
YKRVEAVSSGDAFGVKLDGRTLKTPAAKPLSLPTLALAELVAGEWAAQDEYIIVADMPATRLAFTVIDRLAETREAVAGEVARYAAADLLCYFSDSPQALAERQALAWEPLLEWAEAGLGLRFARTTGIAHAPQPSETVELAQTLALRLDDFALAGLAHAAGLYGSAVLAFAVERGWLSALDAFDLSRLDEAFQEEQWGVDNEAAARTARLRVEAKALDDWFRALR